MAQRRAISKTVTQSDVFLRLPLKTQALYFHLMQETDDDGVVEAYKVLKIIGSSDLELYMLAEEGLIYKLNNQMVYLIVHFKEQNKIRKDRYKAGKYKNLVEKVGLEYVR